MEKVLRDAEELLRDRRLIDGTIVARRLDVSTRLRNLAALSKDWRVVAHPNPVLRNRAAILLDQLDGDSDRPGLDLKKSNYWASRIDSGIFGMGDNNSGYPEEQPQFNYLISQPYALGRFPVTNRQYLIFIEALSGQGTHEAVEAAEQLSQLMRQHRKTPEEFRPRWWSGKHYRSGEGNHPVVGVTWYAASAFAWWVNAWLHALGVLGAGEEVRLPSEAEWERAAAYPPTLPGGSTRAGRREYPWGDAVTDADGETITASVEANIDNGGIDGTSVVGIFPHGAAACGAEELAGNVWEWCSTPKVSYPFTDEVNAESLDTTNVSETYILRGGSWASNRDPARCSHRSGINPTISIVRNGFRLVRLFS